MAMYDSNWVDQVFLMALWVGLIYGLYGLVLAYLAATDLEWRQLIAERLRLRWRNIQLRVVGAMLNLLILTVRSYRWLRN